MADGPYENIRLRRALVANPPKSDPRFVDAVKTGRLFLLWETPSDGSQQYMWMVSDIDGQRSTALFTSAERLMSFHARLPASLQTSSYAMVAGPSTFVLLERAGIDYVQVDPDAPEDTRLLKNEIAEVRAQLGEVPQLQMRVLPLPAPQQSAQSERVDTLSAIPLATAIMVPLLERRVDDAWEIVERYVANEYANETLRAMSLLLWALLDNAAHSAGVDPVALLQEGADAWSQYAEQNSDKDVVDIATIRQLVHEECGICSHPAAQHDVAWTIWEYGQQTDAACVVDGCACEGFESRA